MLLTHVCAKCGAKNKIDAEVFMTAETIVCPACGAVSKNKAKKGGGQAARKPVAPASPAAASPAAVASPSAVVSGAGLPQAGAVLPPPSSACPVSGFGMDLNVEQRMAATYDGEAGAILLLAGAGCGKTRTMIARALFLLQVKHAAPERLAMLTFTRRAAREIEERLEKEIPGVSARITVGTFHRFCLNIIYRHRKFFGDQPVKIMDRSDQEMVFRRIRSSLKEEMGAAAFATAQVPKEREIASVISYASNSCLSIREYYEKFASSSGTSVALMERVVKSYKDYKMTNGYMDYDDILSRVVEGLENEPDLRYAVQNSLDYVLVDEMQDTSPVQWRIIKALYPPVKLFCVGDDAQSIYAFRGADFESVHRFCDVLPNAVTLQLTENYRSCQEILDVSNALLEASPLHYDKHLHAHKGKSGVRPQFLEFMSPEDEARRVVQMIARQLENGVPPGEIMVMLRSSWDGRQLELGLSSYGIPYRIIGGVGILQSAHVKDVIATLEALTLPHNELSWMRVLELLPKVGAKSAEKLYNTIAAFDDQASILSLMYKNLAAKHPDFAGFIKGFPLNAYPDEMLAKIIGFYDDHDILSLRYDNWNERRKDLDILVKTAKEFQTAEGFLEAFKLDADAEANKGSDGNKITLITVHSAKGTEADVCYVLRVQGGSYPHYRSTTEKEIEEDRRVLYVAMTRARKELYLTQVDGGMGFYACLAPESFVTPELRALLGTPSRRRRF